MYLLHYTKKKHVWPQYDYRLTTMHIVLSFWN
uniref:Uncharacterized protein n=1 Tax=Anguilla anguilla TaxID=7936 RepID=A0A0E9WL74_ANGAN